MGSKHRETDETMMPKAERFYCFKMIKHKAWVFDKSPLTKQKAILQWHTFSNKTMINYAVFHFFPLQKEHIYSMINCCCYCCVIGICSWEKNGHGLGGLEIQKPYAKKNSYLLEKATPLSIKYKNKWALSVFSKQQFPQMINFLVLDPGVLFKNYDLLNVGTLSWHIQEMWPLSLIHWLSKFGLEWQIRATRDIVWKHLCSSLRYPMPPGVLINEISQMKNVSSQMVFNWVSRFIHLT